MTDPLFPENITEVNQARIKALAAKVYNKAEDELTKVEVRNVIQMDMATFPTKLVVGATATRPTEVKFSTNNYHTSIEIDLKEVDAVVRTNLDGIEDEGEIVEAYLGMKSALFSLIRIKYEGTEEFLRDLLDVAITKDGCPKVGRSAK
jgi:hypothetical protein